MRAREAATLIAGVAVAGYLTGAGLGVALAWWIEGKLEPRKFRYLAGASA